MSTTNKTLLLVAASLLVGACGPSQPADSADGGPPDTGGGGDPPAFLQGPVVTAVGTTAVTVRFLADRPVQAVAQWRAGTLVGEVTGTDTAAEQALDLQGLPPGRTIEIGIGIRDDGGAASAGLEARTKLLETGTHRVLFDAAHAQDAGNADWIVDTSGRYPSPSNPGHESDWNGAYSAFGFDLWRSGRFDVEILPDGDRFRFGTSDAQDLSKYDVLVIPEPNAPLASGEAEAVAAFVRAGGGLLLIADHDGADRDGDGWDAVRIFGVLLATDDYGIRLAGTSRTDTASVDPGDPIADGPFGPAAVIGSFAGTTLILDRSANPSVRMVAAIHGSEPLAAAASLGQGRIVVHGDSSGADDGTDSGHNSNIYDAWGDPDEDNGTFFLNAVSWLSQEY